MAEVVLEYSSVKSKSDPKRRGCLIVGNVSNLCSVSFDDFSDKLQPAVNANVSNIFKLV